MSVIDFFVIASFNHSPSIPAWLAAAFGVIACAYFLRRWLLVSMLITTLVGGTACWFAVHAGTGDMTGYLAGPCALLGGIASGVLAWTLAILARPVQRHGHAGRSNSEEVR